MHGLKRKNGIRVNMKGRGQKKHRSWRTGGRKQGGGRREEQDDDDDDDEDKGREEKGNR